MDASVGPIQKSAKFIGLSVAKFLKLATLISLAISLPLGQYVFGQSKLATYSNNLHGYYTQPTLKNDSLFGARVNEITLNTDSTFEFWSRPDLMSCFTWSEYKGRWKKENDTIVFYDNYEVVENDMKATFEKSNELHYRIHFSTDKKSGFKNKEIKIGYVYDFNAHLAGIEKTFSLNPENVIEVPFTEVPNYDKLASLTIEYYINNEKRFGNLTEHPEIDLRSGEPSNLITVEFIENPKKEIVYRRTKALIENDKLFIISTTKTKTTLPDYYPEIKFEYGYTLGR